MNLELHRMVRDLRQMGVAQREGDNERIVLFTGRWGLTWYAATSAAFKLADLWFDEFLDGLITETELANAVFFFHRFALRFPFDDLDFDKLNAMSRYIAAPLPAPPAWAHGGTDPRNPATLEPGQLGAMAAIGIGAER